MDKTLDEEFKCMLAEMKAHTKKLSQKPSEEQFASVCLS